MVVFSQVALLISFLVIGYILNKLKIVEAQHGKFLSALLVNVFLPFNLLKSFSANFTVAYLSSNYALVLTSLVILAVTAVGAYFGSKLFSKVPYEQKLFEYSLIVTNSGYMGYPLIESMLGTIGLTNFAVFGIPVTLFTYSYGYAILTKNRLSLRKLLNPITVAMLIGIVIGLSGIPVPSVISEVLNKGSDCLGPISMILTGIVIAEYRIKDILSDARVYVMTVLRLLIIPIVLGLIIKPFVSELVLQNAVLFYALPCGLNSVVFPKMLGENCKIGAGLVLVSHLASCFSIPLLCWIFGI